MPGTLMYECCLHTLRIFLMRLGWVGERRRGRLRAGARASPAGSSAAARCIESTRHGHLRGHGQGARLPSRAVRDRRRPDVRRRQADRRDHRHVACGSPGLTREARRAALGSGVSAVAVEAQPVRLFDREQILAFAIGKPSEAFGDRYRVFDEERVIARLPGPPYSVPRPRHRGSRPSPGRWWRAASVEAEYDVPPDAWYFAADRQARMPFAVLLEVALQPCGWLAAYIGSALTSPSDLSLPQPRRHGDAASPGRRPTPAR